MKREDYLHLLKDTTPCYKIDTSGDASEHELGELVQLDGHASLTSCLNDTNGWGMTVREVADMLIFRDEEEEEKVTTYNITLRDQPGLSAGTTSKLLRYDGEDFREGMFDAETWNSGSEAYDFFESLAENSDFAPGLEMVLTRESFDEESGEIETKEILVKPLS